MATPSRWGPQRARPPNRRGSRIRRRNKRSPKSMLSIDAAVLTTDSVCFERIGDFENSSIATAARNLRTMDDLRWRPTSKLVTFEEGPVLAAGIRWDG